jgi:hypothetical protein
MSPIPDFNPRAAGPAEELIHEVFQGREADADPQVARLRLERRLRSAAAASPVPHLRPSLRFALQLAVGVFALLVFGGWASNLTIKPWDDAQQVTLALPGSWTPADYPRLVGVMCRHGDQLYAEGGHSLIVDYKTTPGGGYFLQLGLLGVDYQTANDWMRGVLRAEPELGRRGYSITQPLVPYAVSVGDMLAFRLAGHSTAVEGNVVEAWQQRSDGEVAATPNPAGIDRLASRNARIYMITRDADYARRASMVEF